MHLKFEHLRTTALDTFALNWRLLDQRSRISESERARIHPVATDDASKLATVARQLTSSFDRQAAGRFVASDRTPDQVSAWLTGLGVAPTCSVALGWDEHTAAVTDFATFTRYWDDFCYPASDDVDIFPEDYSWRLAYSHHEEFTWQRFNDGPDTCV